MINFEAAMKSHGIKLNQTQIQILKKILTEVIDENKKINLTRIDDFEEGLVKHLEDSILALPYFESAPEGDYFDMGSGSGFPALPLGFLSGRPTTLSESVKKKAAALNQIIERLNFQTDMICYAERIEDIARENNEKYSIITARALAPLPALLELASPLLRREGVAIFFKANTSDEEKALAEKIAKLVGFELLETPSFVLSDGSHREFYIYKKVNNSTITLPRRNGMAQKKPLRV